MANVIKLRKGLNINLKGKAAEAKMPINTPGEFALVPDDFVGRCLDFLYASGQCR